MAAISVSSDDDDFLEFLKAPIPKLPPLKKPARKKAAAKKAPSKAAAKRKSTTKASLATTKRGKVDDGQASGRNTPPPLSGLTLTRGSVNDFPLFSQSDISGSSQPRGATDIFQIFTNYKPLVTADLVTSRIRNNFVSNWVSENKHPTRRCKVLLLHGPCGSGKLTLVQHTLKEQGIGMRLWTPNENLSIEGQPITEIDTFRRALLYDRFYSSNVTGDAHEEQKVLVIKNLPATNTEQSVQARKQILDEFITTITAFGGPKLFQCPVIFIFTTGNTHSVKFQLHKEFSESFLQIVAQYEIIAATDAQIKKRLTFIANKEIDDTRRTTQVVKEVMSLVKGDIRHAINELCIRLRAGIPRTAPAQSVPQSQMPKAYSYSTQTDSADDLQNCQILDVFHAAARILSCKKDIHTKRLEHSAVQTLKNVPADADKLLDYVHHSLPRYNQIGDESMQRLSKISRRMSDANVYGNLLGRWEVGTWSDCMFRWSVDSHMHDERPPARATGTEPCHPPPFFRTFENQLVLSAAMSPVVGFGKPLPPTRSELCTEVTPMLNQILFRKNSYPHAHRPMHPKLQLTPKQAEAIRETSFFSMGVWSPPAPRDARLPICDRWQVC
eukprot:TRINITY_DN2329_c3_g1_i2.p1 TRINITY_DN2329_c3_g1~~TRINITY_DN2329_c3_g1_i2.p1  ORF type:complete len:611 (+),score=81.10 TRINITY_DN2329_c3_g1_i2:419-2251(+)